MGSIVAVILENTVYEVYAIFDSVHLSPVFSVIESPRLLLIPPSLLFSLEANNPIINTY